MSCKSSRDGNTQGRQQRLVRANTCYSAWMPNTDLTPLNLDEIKNAEMKGKTKLLAAAYAIAAEDHSLDHYKTMLSDHQAAVDADAEAEAERQAKKASKSKRKSVDASAAGNDDEMDVDEETTTQKSKSKKRKKDAQEDDDADQKVKQCKHPMQNPLLIKC